NLYHEGKIEKILVTGGNGNLFLNEPDESSFLEKEFIRNGVKKEDIILEKKSRNTYENAIFSKKILDSLKLKPPYILITSASHMPRS
ncbi:YdcF family protein, partial [Staphylococcus aureus]